MPRLLARALSLCAVHLALPVVTTFAAFVLTGDLPPSLVGPETKVSVLRESLEARASTEVASAPVGTGRFQLSVEAEPGLFNLQIGENKASFVAAADQTVRVSLAEDGKTLRVDGTPDQERFNAYESFRTASLARLVLPVREANRRARAAGNDAEIDRLTEAEVTGYAQHRRELNDFTIEKLGGSPALYAASLRWEGDHRLDELAGIVAAYSEKHADLEIARQMVERIARFKATALGAPAPELTGTGPDGRPLALSSLRGRVVLVDFWASWCAPCRTENQHYVELYREHRAAGFEIVAVSVDQNERAWKAAIVKDQATWLHVSDLNGWKSPLAARYNVTALPASFLLDREGRIIAKDARGERLSAALAAAVKTAP